MCNTWHLVIGLADGFHLKISLNWMQATKQAKYNKHELPHMRSHLDIYFFFFQYYFSLDFSGTKCVYFKINHNAPLPPPSLSPACYYYY